MNLKKCYWSISEEKVHDKSYFIHLFITEISIFYKINGAYNDRLMGLIEKKMRKIYKNINHESSMHCTRKRLHC